MTLTKLSRYIIKGQLGVGGMATVYHAYDPSFERDVAIKVLPESLMMDPQFKARFTREAKAIARLEHPMIVPVYDVGEENNQPFIVMRYMSGGSLAERIKQHPISLEEAAQIVQRLAPALDAAHQQGIIHRDLKPGNILFDQYGNSFLSDFGIARMGQTDGPALTGNFILGTPAYMSPEQARGEGDLDGRSDIYSLGATLFEMLSGRVPFEAETPMAQALKQIIEPTPSILDLCPDLPLPVQMIINRSMEKDRQLRYSTTEEMSRELSAIAQLAETVITESPSPERYRPSTPLTVRPRPEEPATLPPSPEQVAKPSQLAPAKKPGIQPAFLVLGLVVVLGFVISAIFLIPKLIQGKGAAQATLPVEQAEVVAQPTEAPTEAPAAEVVPTDTLAPTETLPPEPTETTTPPTETLPPANLVLGASDRLAYVIGNNIWMAKLDGSDPVQLTRDDSQKTSLQWTPDGKSIWYISGKCLRSIDPETSQINDVTCFKYAKSFADFEINKDGTKVAISVNNQLFIVPLDLPRLTEANTNSGLTAMAECADFAPYKGNAVKGMQWSSDGNTLAILVIGVLDDGRQGDIVQLLPVDRCIPNPRVADNFPPPRFEVPEYDDNPRIQSFSWDGVGLFVFTTIIRNQVFGNLYFYNSQERQGYVVNPIKSTCCYSDAIWSTNGDYLFFAYQDYGQGSSSKTELFYVPLLDIEAGGTFTPIPFPAIDDQRANPSPALRPAP